MASDEVRYLHIRKLMLANEPDNEYEFEISSSSYNRLKTEFGKDDEDDDSYVMRMHPRLLYDWTRQVCHRGDRSDLAPSGYRRAIVNSLFNRVEALMQSEGIRLASGQNLRLSTTPTTLKYNGRSRYIMKPDRVIFFKTVDAGKFKVVVEVVVSQTYDSLLEKARKWLYDKKCEIIILLAFYEKERYSAPRKRTSLTSRQFGPLEFRGHTWLEEISERFIEIALMNMKYVRHALLQSVTQNTNRISSSVPHSVGDMRLAELIPLVQNAVDRFKTAVKRIP
ncbi:hypothetical protein V1517DRAFT_352380 [Lipomyces orientalis]|uniref:Uncharacterized protein n=1 Tax=Lipomyces orientalis TaxID=1233043 RepID=A0ACC3TPL3_9ASCO